MLDGPTIARTHSAWRQIVLLLLNGSVRVDNAHQYGCCLTFVRAGAIVDTADVLQGGRILGLLSEPLQQEVVKLPGGAFDWHTAEAALFAIRFVPLLLLLNCLTACIACTLSYKSPRFAIRCVCLMLLFNLLTAYNACTQSCLVNPRFPQSA